MWLAERILGTKLENQNLTVKLLKINFKHQLSQFAISMNANLYAKNQHHSSIVLTFNWRFNIGIFSPFFPGFIPYKVEKPLRSMGLQEKEKDQKQKKT